MTRCLVATLVAVVFVGCTPAGPLCAKRQECIEDLAADDERVCKTAYDANLDALRENAEPECQALADRQVEFDTCRASLDCADFKEPDLNGLCRDESERYADALKDAKGECASTD